MVSESRPTSSLYEWQRAVRDPENGMDKKHLLVALVVSTWMDGKGGGAYPSIQLIAECSRVSRSTAKRRLHVLRDLGWLSLELRDENGRSSYLYSATIPVTYRTAKDQLADLEAQFDDEPFGHIEAPVRASADRSTLRRAVDEAVRADEEAEVVTLPIASQKPWRDESLSERDRMLAYARHEAAEGLSVERFGEAVRARFAMAFVDERDDAIRLHAELLAERALATSG